MGFSHFKSNVIGKTGNEYIATLAAIKNITAITGTTVTGNSVVGTSHLKLGTEQYIFQGNANTEATILAEATALVATPIKGSMYMSRKGNLWFYTSDSTASPVQNLA